MSERLTVVANFKDLAHDDAVQEAIERRCDELAGEFPELTRVELTLSESSGQIEVHGHATGKHRDVGAHASHEEARVAADRALDKLERQLRTLHDKKIFAQRRDAQRRPPKKQNAS